MSHLFVPWVQRALLGKPTSTLCQIAGCLLRLHTSLKSSTLAFESTLGGYQANITYEKIFLVIIVNPTVTVENPLTP